MSMPTDELVVVTISGGVTRVFAATKSFDAELSDLGFFRKGDELSRAISSEDDRKAVAVALVKLGAIFSSGKEWSPEEVLDLYREQGIFTERYRVISWRTPATFVISNR